MISKQLTKRTIDRLAAIEASDSDSDLKHLDADRALLDLLTQAGASDVVEAWEAIKPKWFSRPS